MLADLLEHVVEETEASRDLRTASTVEVDGNMYVGLFGSTLYLGTTFASEQECSDGIPVGSNQRTIVHQASTITVLGFEQPLTTIVDRTVLGQKDALTAKIVCQLNIRQSVSYDVAVGKIIQWLLPCLTGTATIDVLLKHTGARLTIGMIVLREMRIEIHVIEIYAFSAKYAEDKIVDLLEPRHRIILRSEAILIADNHEIIVERMANEREILYDTRKEFDLLELIDLFGDRWFDDKGSVAIDEEALCH